MADEMSGCVLSQVRSGRRNVHDNECRGCHLCRWASLILGSHLLFWSLSRLSRSVPAIRLLLSLEFLTADRSRHG